MSRALVAFRSTRAVQIDIVAIFLLLLAAAEFPYLGTYWDTNPYLAFKGVFASVILAIGVAGSLAVAGWSIDNLFNIGEILNNSFWIVLAVFAIFAANIGVQLVGLSSATISGALFVTLMAVAETFFFQGFILTGVYRMTGNPYIANLAHGVMAAAYHTAVYGVSDSLILIVFLSFLALGASYSMSRYRLSVPMAAHVFVNLLSSMG